MQPDAIVTYVATRGFSSTAREVFDIIWQSKEGIMSVSKIRAAYAGTRRSAKNSDYSVEQALLELFQGLAVFEMFRFDEEDRLVRVAGLLSEIRQWRETMAGQTERKIRLKPRRGTPSQVVSYTLDLSDRICQLVASIAAKPARLRNDGDLFREDRRRLNEICPDDADSSEKGAPAPAGLNTCLWAAQGVGWLAQVDNELRAGNLDPLLELDRIDRHWILAEWLLSTEREACSRQILTNLLAEVKPGAWYPTLDVIEYAMTTGSENEPFQLRSSGGHWHYTSATAGVNSELSLVRSIEETFLWLGIVDRATDKGNSLFRVSPLGECLLLGKNTKALAAKFPKRTAKIIVQPNFDIVVPTQDMDPLLTVPLDQFAERSSTGKATVYHLSKESLTRAIQEGHDGGAFIEFLLAHNQRGRLPSNVLTTLEDWRGGIRRVRLRTLQVLETEDPLVLADLLHRRRFKKVLASTDPQRTAVYSKITKAELTKQLEKDGFIVE